MSKQQSTRTWVEISKANLLHNISIVKKLLTPGTKLFAVVKSNAYGHGMRGVSQAIQNVVNGFCVANSGEALDLATYVHNKPIIILSYFTTLEQQHLKLLYEKGIEIPLYSHEILEKISKSGLPFRVHIKFDVGTSRIGFQTSEVTHVIEQLKQQPQLTIRGIYAHFADIEDTNSNFSDMQLKRFDKVAARFKQAFPNIQAHIACSASISRLQESHYDLVRLGIHLYGLSGMQNTKEIGGDLRPVLSWKCLVLQVKRVLKDTSIGYGKTYITKKETTIVTLPVGYWDGYDRSLSNSGITSIKKTPCHIRGTICMNLTMCEPEDDIQINPGDVATLIGDECSATTIASLAQTINYEIVTRIHPDIPRYMI